MMEFKDGKNTGRTVRVLVTYILEEFAGLEDGYCIMATSLMNENGEPFDRADLNQICADIRANGDGYVDGGEEYIMIEMQSESLQGEKKIENNICESVFSTRSRGIRKNLYKILRDCTPVIADLCLKKAEVRTKTVLVKYISEKEQTE